MNEYMILRGDSKEVFDAMPFDDNPQTYRTTQYYIQALLKKCPHDINKLITCPEGETTNNWIYGMFRQFLQELNFYAYEHRDVSTAATDPQMEFYVNGQKIACLSSVFNPPKSVPAIDYITGTIDSATSLILDPKYFSSQLFVSPESRDVIVTYMRRLYRIFAFSYLCHNEVFEKIEKKTHICERFTKFGKLYGLLEQRDTFIPESAFAHE